MGDNDKRRFRRLTPRGGTVVEVCREGGPDLAGGVADITAAGAKLVLSEELSTGTVLRITLHGPGGESFSLLAVVVWSQAVAGAFHTGVAFRAAVAGADLAALTGPQP